MNKEISCLLCDKDHGKYSILHEKLRYDHLGKIYKCEICGLVFLSPRLSEFEQKKYYREQYRDEYEEISVEQRFSGDMNEAKRRLQGVKELLSSDNNILEIGSGSGAFLELSSVYFNHVSGVELDIRAQSFLKDKGLNIYPDLDKIKGKKFDVILMFHVLEHLLEPVEFIKKISNHLNDAGKLIIEVPNVEDALLKFYNIDAFKDFYFCSAHLSYFSLETLKSCLKKANFIGEVSFVQRYDLNNHLHWLESKISGGFPENRKIFSEETLKAYEADLRSKGLSDTLWGVFKKG
jgi:2-polyprenyl-3-methyl-5-hydroxy-6-metoxy-1,4-benzoquinol methylase